MLVHLSSSYASNKHQDPFYKFVLYAINAKFLGETRASKRGTKVAEWPSSDKHITLSVRIIDSINGANIVRRQ